MKPLVAPTARPAIVMPSISTKGSPSMSMRSAKVPLSPSSALQTMYFCSAGVSCTVFHLMPVGKPAPPRPRSPDLDTSSTMPAGASDSALLEALVAAVRAVVVERQRIDDAAAREGQARLAGEIVDLVDRAQRCGMRRAGPSDRRAAGRRPAGRRRLPARSGRSRSARRRSRPRPAAPATACRASRCGRSRPERPVCAGAAGDGGGHGIGAARPPPPHPSARRRAPCRAAAPRRAWPWRRRGWSCAGLLQQRIELGRRQPADHAAVEHRRRPGGAEAEAIDRLQRDAAVGAGAAAGDAEPVSRRAPPAPRSPSPGRPRRGTS